MSRFNESARGANTTTNHEGEVAYTLTPKLELYSAVVTTMMSDKFYESNAALVTRIRELVREVSRTDPMFVAQLAVYAREQMHLRTVPLVLAVELAKLHKGDQTVSKTVERVVCRPDEITELAAYYVVANKTNGIKKLNKLSNQIRKGLAATFNKFDAYQFQKYNRKNAIKLVDMLFLTHPKAKDAAQQSIFDQIVSDTLPTPQTWETAVSAAGSDETNKREAWEKMIDSRKMGYMATVRNLRNIVEAGVSENHIDLVCEYLSNPEAVRKSKMFPFRFFSAYRELESTPGIATGKLMNALEAAVLVAAQNIPGFAPAEKVHVSVDTSGSMSSTVSDNSKMKMQDIGLVMAMLLHQVTPNIETTIFGTLLEHVNLTKNNILGGVTKLRQYSDKVGSSTNGYLIPADLIARKVVMDKVVVFTDCQLYSSSGYGYMVDRNFSKLWKQYKKEVAPNAKLYLFDLTGYGNTPVSVQDDGVYLISGWSEKTFDMLEAYENGSSAIKKIEAIEL